MATAATASHSTKLYLSMFSAVWQKLLLALKLAQFSNLSKEQALIAIEQTVQNRYFAVPKADKALMQEALAAIEDPTIKARSKAAFRDILTDPALSMRLKRLRFGIVQVIKHLIKIGQVNAAEQLFIKLNNVESSNTDSLALPAKNLGLDYKRTQILLDWQQQNQVWSAAASTNTLANMLAIRESAAFTAALLADRQKMLVPTFARHCEESEPLTTLAVDAQTVASGLSDEPLLPFVEPLTSPASLTFSAVAAQAAPALRQNVADKSTAKATNKRQAHKPRALAGA